MKSRMMACLLAMVFLLVNCTGEKAPIKKHEGERTQVLSGDFGPADEGKNIVAEINGVQDEAERIQRSEQYMMSDFMKAELRVKYSNETQQMISFLVRKWTERGKIGLFNKLVDFIFSDADIDSRVIDGLHIPETKKLIYKSAEESKDPIFRFKLVLLMNKIQEVGTTDEDLLFMQNQISSIKNETNFSFIKDGNLWVKTNRDLIEHLLTTSLNSKIKIDEKEFSGATITRSQREKLLTSLTSLKKDITQVLSPNAAKELSDYKKNIQRMKTDIPVFTSKIGLQEITNENELGLVVSMLISDIDANNTENMIKSGLINPSTFKVALGHWVNYEVAQIILKYKEEFAQFQKKRVNYQSADYFPELRKSLAMSQTLSRERIEKVRIFLPATKSLKADGLHKKIVDMDIFLKRFLTSNSVLVLLKMFAENNIDIKEEVKLNDQIIKKDSSANIKVSNIIPNVLMISEGFYLGELADQFEFSQNDRMLQKFEVLDGLADGIKLGLFKELGYDEQDLLKNLFMWLAQSRLVQIAVVKPGQGQEAKVFKLHEGIKVKLRSAQLAKFQSQCEAWKANQDVEREFDLEDLQKSLLVGKLSDNIESNASSSEHGGGSDVMGLFPYNSEITKALEFIRADISYVVLYMETLSDSLADAGLENSKIAKELENFKGFYTQFLTDYLGMAKTFDECYYLKRKKEQELVNKVLAYEKKYWEFVLSKVNAQSKTLVSSIAPLSYALPTNISSRSYFNAGQLSVIHLDFYFRVKQYVEYGLNLGSVQLPPIDPALKINFSAGMATQTFYRKAEIRSVAFSSSETLDSKVQKIVTVHEFAPVKGGSQADFVNWFGKGKLSASKLSEQFNIAYSLYRFGPTLNNSFDIRSPFDLEHITKIYYHGIFLLHITDDTKTTLDLIGVKDLFDREDFQRFKFILKELDIAYPFFDNLLTEMSRSFIGYYGLDSNFIGDRFATRRPIQLLSSDFIMKSLYRYYDESYVSVYRDKKMKFDRYSKRLTDEMDVLKKIGDYIDYVEKTSQEKEYTIRIRTTQELKVPLYSQSAKDNLGAIVKEMKDKMDVINSIKQAGAK
tara:strand:- start:73161 stop:76379 length:3219 start_codon:yes stop_codon:yes gene_type:complete